MPHAQSVLNNHLAPLQKEVDHLRADRDLTQLNNALCCPLPVGNRAHPSQAYLPGSRRMATRRKYIFENQKVEKSRLG